LVRLQEIRELCDQRVMTAGGHDYAAPERREDRCLAQPNHRAGGWAYYAKVRREDKTLIVASKA